jgi:hypothetical protein
MEDTRRINEYRTTKQTEKSLFYCDKLDTYWNRRRKVLYFFIWEGKRIIRLYWVQTYSFGRCGLFFIFVTLSLQLSQVGGVWTRKRGATTWLWYLFWEGQPGRLTGQVGRRSTRQLRSLGDWKGSDTNSTASQCTASAAHLLPLGLDWIGMDGSNQFMSKDARDAVRCDATRIESFLAYQRHFTSSPPSPKALDATHQPRALPVDLHAQEKGLMTTRIKPNGESKQTFNHREKR